MIAAETEDDLLETPEVGGTAFERFEFQAVRFSETGIHAVEVGGEERSLGAASAGADLHDGVLVFVGVRGGEKGDLELALEFRNQRLQGGNLRLGELSHFGVGAGGEFLVFRKLATGLLERSPLVEDGAQLRVLAQDVLGPLRVGEKLGRADSLLQFGEAVLFAGDEVGKIHDVENGYGAKDSTDFTDGMIRSIRVRRSEKALGINAETVTRLARGVTVSSAREKSRRLFGGAGGLDAAVAAREFLDAAGGIDELLLTGEKTDGRRRKCRF